MRSRLGAGVANQVQYARAAPRGLHLPRTFLGSRAGHAGDGFFATFDVPSHAVECALSFQRELTDLEGPERILSRVGIHMGQIVSLSEGGEADAPRALYGVAVDTAARVSSMGVVCLASPRSRRRAVPDLSGSVGGHAETRHA